MKFPPPLLFIYIDHRVINSTEPQTAINLHLWIVRANLEEHLAIDCKETTCHDGRRHRFSVRRRAASNAFLPQAPRESENVNTALAVLKCVGVDRINAGTVAIRRVEAEEIIEQKELQISKGSGRKQTLA